jgi:hypothetical protein
MAFFALLCAALTTMSGTASAATVDEHASTWSGYVDQGATFTDVVATWIQPAITCTVPTARASFWIGFDGFGNGTVEQVGTIGTCAGAGQPVVYRGWWEMVASSGNRGGEPIAVAAGDRVVASVRYRSGSYVLDVRDATSGAHFKVTKPCTVVCARSMAEWIVERPGSGTYPLARYGKFDFTGATAKAVAPGARGGISMFPQTLRLTMENKGTVLSRPGRLTSGGTAFRCHWRAAE